MNIDNIRHLKAPSPGQDQETIATVSEYQTAEAIVDYLSDESFPVEYSSIVASGLNLTENVTGRLTKWSAFKKGTNRGLAIGLFIVPLFLVLTFVPKPTEVVVIQFIYLTSISALLGGLLDLIRHLLSKGRRDFDSSGSLDAESYEVKVRKTKVSEARKIISASAYKEFLISDDRPLEGRSVNL